MAGLYIHIPFCHSKCSYCDFYSGLSPAASKGYADAIISELQLRRDEIEDRFRTIYIGGGTPSTLPVDDLRRIVSSVYEATGSNSVEEFTIEVNPEDVTLQLLDSYRELGINRISMGVQSFDDTLLKAINRRHTARQAIEAMELLKTLEWNHSVDLMFGLPGQSLQAWQEDVDRLMTLEPPHFSAYLLSYEPGTRLYAMREKGKVEEAPEELATSMQEYVTAAARQNGYRHYEISNYARPDCESRHNGAYWDMTPYLGLGASAHSFDGNVRRINPANLRLYTDTLAQGIVAAEIEEENIDEIFNDHIITGLRTSAGLSLTRLRKRFPDGYVEDMLTEARVLLAGGQLCIIDNMLRIPEEHWLRSDNIMRALLRVD